MRYYSKIDSIIGELFLVAEDDMLSVIHLGEADFYKHEDTTMITFQPEYPCLKEAARQLQEYFSGKRRTFHLQLSVCGTSFQRSVWEQLSLIPFGETRSYQDIAVAIENPKAVRAIGQANKSNRYPIIIPCHRVIGKNRSLTGYAGTRVDIKEKLLEFEGAL